MTKVLIVEDQRIHREYMETLLSQEGHYELLPSVTAADVAVQLCKTNPVQLVLMDIAVNGMMDGIEATAKLKDMSPNIKIIIVTSMLDTECLVNAKEAGADSIWYKDASEEALMDVIDRTMQGEHIFPDNSPAVHIGFARSDKFGMRYFARDCKRTKQQTDLRKARHLRKNCGLAHQKPVGKDRASK